MKFSGKIGFWQKSVQTNPGVFKPGIVEKDYTGDILKDYRRWQNGENQQNENLNIASRISIISDLYMQQNWGSIAYVKWNGVNWKVSSIDPGSYPRIIIDLGGVWNGKTGTT